MIRKIKFKNFYSFKKEQIIDFTTSKKKSEMYHTSFDGKQISKVIGIIGPNNSGKTNIMKLFGFFKFFLTSTTRENKNEYKIAFRGYAFSPSSRTNLFIEFETTKHLCEYSLALNETEVLQEKLRVRKLEKNARPVSVFSREKEKVTLNSKIIKGVTAKRLDSIRKDVSVIAFIKANYEEPLISEISDYFNNYWTNVNEAGFVHSPEERMGDVAAVYNEIPEIKKDMEELIRKFNLGIDGFKITEVESAFDVEARHRISNREYVLPIAYESRGTKSLFVELIGILATIKLNGTLLALDEIDLGLHPEAVNKLVFFIAEHFANAKKQLIFASHSLDFVKKFDPPQIYLVEKVKNESTVFRLDDLDIRSDDNHFAKYMTGSYGAFPRISL